MGADPRTARHLWCEKGCHRDLKKLRRRISVGGSPLKGPSTKLSKLGPPVRRVLNTSNPGTEVPGVAPEGAPNVSARGADDVNTGVYVTQRDISDAESISGDEIREPRRRDSPSDPTSEDTLLAADTSFLSRQTPTQRHHRFVPKGTAASKRICEKTMQGHRYLSEGPFLSKQIPGASRVSPSEPSQRYMAGLSTRTDHTLVHSPVPSCLSCAVLQ